MGDLNQMAKDMGIENFGTMKKHEVIFQILKRMPNAAGSSSPKACWRSCPKVLASSARKASITCLVRKTSTFRPLKFGALTYRRVTWLPGQIRPPKEKERFFALLKVEAVGRKTRTKPRTRRISTT